MSFHAVTWALEQDVTPSACKFVLVSLASFADAAGASFPSQETIAKHTGQSERSVRAHLAALEASGYVRRGRRHRKDGSRTSDLLTLIFDRAEPESLPANLATGEICHRQISPNLPAKSAAQNLSEEHPDKAKEKRATRIAEDWAADQTDADYAASKGITAERLPDVAEAFRDHWLAKAGKDGTALDWRAKWRTWVRNEIKFGESRNAKRPANPSRRRDPALDALDRWAGSDGEALRPADVHQRPRGGGDHAIPARRGDSSGDPIRGGLDTSIPWGDREGAEDAQILPRVAAGR